MTGPPNQTEGMGRLRRPWYERHPERFSEECAEMSAKGFLLDEDAFRASRRVEFSGLSTADPGRRLIARYPDAFPSFPPRVFSNGTVLVRHQRPDSKEICIFGPGQPRWSAELCGVAAIDEAEDVIKRFGKETKMVPVDDVPEPMTAVYRYAPARVLVPPAISTKVALNREGVVGEFHLLFHNLSGQEFSGRGVMLDIRISDKTIKAEEVYRSWLRRGTDVRDVRGKLVFLSSPPPYMTNLEELEKWLAQIGVSRDKWMTFVFPEQAVTSSSTRLSWLVVRSSKNGPLHLLKTLSFLPAERYARIPRMTGLGDKKAVFIGCGNLGSKIAVPLAATGLSRFTLVDPEEFEPDNSMRHEVTIEQFGVLKVKALYHRLLGFNPELAGKVDWLTILVGGTNPLELEEKLVEAITSADIIIETTGVHAVSRYINELCYDFKVPALYASVTNGAWGGELVRTIPAATACWMCWFNQYEFSRPPTEPEPEHGVFAPGCNQPTFTGTSYETGIVANMAAWMAAETLVRLEPAHKDFGGDYLRWAARNQDGLPCPSIEILPVQKRAGCPVCSVE